MQKHSQHKQQTAPPELLKAATQTQTAGPGHTHKQKHIFNESCHMYMP